MGPRVIQCLVVNPEKWSLCYLAWKMRHERKSIAEIHRATHLYKTDKGYSQFFGNLIYTGHYAHGGVIYKDFAPALIPIEWYEEEQARRQERAKKRKGEEVSSALEPRRVSSTSLLSGKLFCESVSGEQHAMHAHRSPATKHRSAWSAYECSVRKHSHGEGCPFYGVSQPAVDKAVVDTILRNVITRENLRPLAEALNSQLASQQTRYSTELDNLQTRIAEAERQRRKYARLIQIDDDPSPTLITELKRFERDKAALLEQKRQLEIDGPTSIGSQPITDAQLDEYLERVRAVLNSEDGFLAKRILDHFVAYVSVKKGTSTGTLYYTFPSDFFAPDLSSLRTHSLEALG